METNVTDNVYLVLCIRIGSLDSEDLESVDCRDDPYLLSLLYSPALPWYNFAIPSH